LDGQTIEPSVSEPREEVANPAELFDERDVAQSTSNRGEEG
jgi:hypothetical protein